MKKTISPFLLLTCIFWFVPEIKAQKKPGTAQPNIILIMSDDMGYSDIGCYGSEINTPNLDQLAAEGVRYTQFYNQARCCPTRASLLTGLYPHQAGMGWMTAVAHEEKGYAGDLSSSAVTIAEVLKPAGYSTYMVGKWHVANDLTGKATKKNWPLQRGFDKYYGIIKGAADFYDPGTLCRGNELISSFNDPEYKPEHYYFTNALTDNAIRFIEDDAGKKPFFMYLAYTAAHWPMQAPEAEIDKYRNRYDSGWDYQRRKRLEKMKQLGMIDRDIVLSPLDSHPWAEEQHKPAMARRMETYAAMVSIMDEGIGQLIAELKRKGIYENTIILFLEDNGGNAESVGFGGPGGETRPLAADTAGLKPLAFDAINLDNMPVITRKGELVMQGIDLMAGPETTYLSYLKPWAEVSNTPFKKYKHYVHEGGIATPLIVHWPARIKSQGAIRTQVCDVIDILPTLVDIAGANYPSNFRGNTITPVAGVSLSNTFNSDAPLARKAIFWEHEMNRAVRMGKWKLVATGNLFDGGYGHWKFYNKHGWELYDMENDRSELRDLSGQYPEIVEEMSALWLQWATTHDIYPTPWQEKEPALRSNYTTDERGN